MTTNITEHLCQVEVAIEKTKALLSPHSYPDDLQTVILAATIDQLIEHHGAMLLLIRAGKTGSAFELARSSRRRHVPGTLAKLLCW
jgi:hypothetical protein